MSAVEDTLLDEAADVHVHEMTAEEGWAMLDARSREVLGIGAEEFIRRWESGEIDDPDRTEILGLAFMIAFTR